FPSWEQFIEMIQEKFRDVAIKEVHKKQMYDLHMNDKTAQEYFQEKNNNNAETQSKGTSTTTSLSNKKTGTGTTYGGQGKPMDIDAIRKEGKCFRCGQKGHLSKNCPLQLWNKKKEEVRASMTKPAMDSKIEEVKDAAEK
ncbi:hypothetical protein ARMSODRAFT_881030, partial [Armillaria solidipes]